MARTIVVLPWPPSVNHYWGQRGGKRFLSPRVRAWRREAWVSLRGVGARFTTPVRVEIHAYPPDGRKRDIDNPIKAVLDALTHAKILQDDSLVRSLFVLRHSPARPGWVEVTIDDWSEGGKAHD